MHFLKSESHNLRMIKKNGYLSSIIDNDILSRFFLWNRSLKKDRQKKSNFVRFSIM